MIGIITCEESQEVTKAFREKGHAFYSNDIIGCSGGHPEWHWQKPISESILNQQTLPYLENPIPHKYARDGFISVVSGKWVEGIGKYNQVIQPYQFGHGEKKATCLWLINLPYLKPNQIVEGRDQRIWKMPPSKDRAKLRSKTYSGIAKAMADQWG